VIVTVLHVNFWFGHFSGGGRVVSVCYITLGCFREMLYSVMYRVGGWSKNTSFALHSCLWLCPADFGLAKQKHADSSRMNSVVGTILCSWYVLRRERKCAEYYNKMAQ